MPDRKASNPNQFLQLVGHTYYARVRVPRALEKRLKATHLRRSLKTGDLAEANKRKHAVVTALKGELNAAAAGVPSLTRAFPDATQYREELKRLREAGDHETAEHLESLAVDKAHAIEEQHGYPKARSWFRAATVTDENLIELQTKWLAACDFRESTKYGYRQALTEALAFLGDPDAHPKDITRAAAISYIDQSLTQRKLAYNTIRDRLAALTSYWGWLVSRDVVQLNPWTGHKISRKQHTGRGEAKRAFTEAELVKLLKGSPKADLMASAGYLRDLTVLQMFSGCRLEEVCSRLAGDVEWFKGYAVLHVRDSKTKAGVRAVAFTHAAPLAVLKRRTQRKRPSQQLFDELKAGGLDAKFSKDASNYFTRYRRACAVPEGTDNHSYRRTVATVLEQAGVRQVLISRFTGHKIGTLAADTYSEGGSVAQSRATSKQVRYGAAVEKAALAWAKGATK